ncbi:sigma-54 dependent transcriptional regulator [Stakelama sediminis]|uniref:Two-component system C4-dicarboxylate transport response regulator DctD n=1 Tax=Stakelama sediminis TaxID=463200 RepID=A0A840YY00_9SPHN|nr:sigma-54 dependent transcriptional regulator [Stakelama sediminis]MBB5718548.1 two-component system C4-dicarboxylate transport response regulator DctD [Stakelama sediminis]
MSETETETDGIIFFVDDNAELREANVQALDLEGLPARAFADAQSALNAIDIDFPGIVVTDVRMPGMDGLEFFGRVREIDPEIPVILITGHADVPMAIGAMRNGAFEFLTKPFAADHLAAAARRALKTRRLVVENRQLRQTVDHTDSPLIGESPQMVRLRETIGQLARADLDVLIEGETGTGKELVAILLHRQGRRRGRPFVAVNCGALPEAIAEAELFGHEQGAVPHGRLERKGHIERSGGGTLFLDEIDSMSPAVQAKMLRVLEEREVMPLGAGAPTSIDLRVVAAAKGDSMALVESGRLREDLFYRLNVTRLRIPPLRERREDIPLLFAHFVEAAIEQTGQESFEMTDAIRRYLIEHDWPGNVRELRNFAFNAVLGLWAEGGMDQESTELSLADRVERFEASLIRETLDHSDGDIRTVMAALKLPRKTLYDKMRRHGIDPDAYRRKNGSA